MSDDPFDEKAATWDADPATVERAASVASWCAPSRMSFDLVQQPRARSATFSRLKPTLATPHAVRWPPLHPTRAPWGRWRT